MGCPVHIWVPLMAAAAPVVHVAKDRLNALRYRTSSDEPSVEAAPSPRRWSPIDPHAPSAASDS